MKKIYAIVLAALGIGLLVVGPPVIRAYAGSQGYAPNLVSCAPLPSQAGLPGVDGSQWLVLTSGMGNGGVGTPGLICVGSDARPYVLACRLGAGGGCASGPMFVKADGWGAAWP